MIGSLLPSVFPNGSFGLHDSGGDDSPAVRNTVSAPLAPLRGVDGEESERGVRHGGYDFVHTAKNMIGDALKTFSHDLRDSFHELGFKSDMVMRLAHDVMYAAKKALKSGADFTANLMMAAVSQTTMTGPAGTSSSFEMVASEIEITVNHATGSVEINATQVEIKSRLSGDAGAPAPQLVDFIDTEGLAGGTDAAPVLAMNDLDSILGAADESGEAEALGPVLAGLPEDVSETDETGGTDPADDTEIGATEEGGEGTAPAAEDGEVIPVPELSGVSHIIVTAFERYLNAEQEQITYVKFDAVIPLGAPGPDESFAEAVAEEVIEEILEPTEVPLVEQVIEEPVGQPATTDLVA